MTGRKAWPLLLVGLLCLTCAGGPGVSPRSLDWAVETVRTGYGSQDLQVKKRAMEGLQYLPQSVLQDEGVFESLWAFVDACSRGRILPEEEQLLEPAFKALNAINSEEFYRRIELLDEWSLAELPLFTLYSIIGFEKLAMRDNVFYLIESAYDPLSGYWPVLRAIVYGEHYLKSGDEKYLYHLKYEIPEFLTVDEALFLYNYLKEKGLPLNRLLSVMFKAGEVLPFDDLVSGGGGSGFSRTYSLDELMFQALLYRIGESRRVYKREFALSDPAVTYEGRVLSGITDPEELNALLENYEDAKLTVSPNVKIRSKDLRSYSFSPYFPVCDAMAYFFAGAAEEEHFLVMEKYFSELDRILMRRITEYLIASPAGLWKERLLEYIINMGDRELGEAAVSGYEKGRGLPLFLKAKWQELDPYISGKAVAMAVKGDLQYVYLLMASEEEFSRVAAAVRLFELKEGL